MVVDTSALIAVLLKEPDANTYLDAMIDAEILLLSTVSAFEFGMVAISRAGVNAEDRVDRLLSEFGIQIRPVDAAMALAARAAFAAFGKGRHTARLNFGDCFSYALAKSLNEPLLYKGHDFAKTDVISAI